MLNCAAVRALLKMLALYVLTESGHVPDERVIAGHEHLTLTSELFGFRPFS